MPTLKYRRIIRCKYLDKLSNSKIADILEVTEGHYRKLRREAIEEYKEVLQNEMSANERK